VGAEQPAGAEALPDDGRGGRREADARHVGEPLDAQAEAERRRGGVPARAVHLAHDEDVDRAEDDAVHGDRRADAQQPAEEANVDGRAVPAEPRAAHGRRAEEQAGDAERGDRRQGRPEHLQAGDVDEDGVQRDVDHHGGEERAEGPAHVAAPLERALERVEQKQQRRPRAERLEVVERVL
jgi:hypothetical protein